MTIVLIVRSLIVFCIHFLLLRLLIIFLSSAYCFFLIAYPFFHIDPTRYPLVEKRRLFVAMYLSKLLRVNIKTSEHEKIDPVLDAVERFQLACHMLWGFWSVIRAPQAATATSFDMLYYGQKR